jgi:predicted dehydrogenase
MNLRFLPALAALRSVVADGELGRVMRALVWFGYDLSRWRPETDYRASYSASAKLGGGIVLDAIHELDYLSWLLGPATSVVASTATVSDLEIDVEDTAVAAIELASGAIATVDLDFVSPVYRRGCVLTGTEAVASWDWHSRAIEIAGAAGDRRIGTDGSVEDTYAAEIADFLATARGERGSSVPAAEGSAAVRLAEAIKRSAATGARVSL